MKLTAVASVPVFPGDMIQIDLEKKKVYHPSILMKDSHKAILGIDFAISMKSFKKGDDIEWDTEANTEDVIVDNDFTWDIQA